MVVGLFWATLVRPEDVWTPEKAAEYQAASSALQHAEPAATTSTTGDMGSPAGGAPRGVDPAARRRFEAISAELEAARYVRDGWGRLIVSAGLALTILSGMGYLAVRGD